MSLSGLEELATFGKILQSLLGDNAEYNAVIAELLAVVEAWPALTTAKRAKILQQIRLRPK